MAETYDIVFAGAGHNGLTAACYLAKAGFSVCMCEQSDMVGGGVISREGLTAPGSSATLVRPSIFWQITVLRF